MDALDEVRSHLREAEAVQRTYLITGGDTLPPAFKENIDGAKHSMLQVKRLTADNPAQQARIPDIDKRMEELQKAWSPTASLWKKQRYDAARQVVRGAM